MTKHVDSAVEQVKKINEQILKQSDYVRTKYEDVKKTQAVLGNQIDTLGRKIVSAEEEIRSHVQEVIQDIRMEHELKGEIIGSATAIVETNIMRQREQLNET